MLTESFISSVRAEPKTANTSISKDNGIYSHTLFPLASIKSHFKKSSTQPNCLAISTTHIFAAQKDKAVVHVYSRERGNQEALISFPERIHTLTLIHDGLLALGTAEGRIIFWEVSTGRQMSTLRSHLQGVSCLAATTQHLISGSEDSNILVWSIPLAVSLSAKDAPQPLQSLRNHRAMITSLVVGRSSASTNICVSASKDNSCIIWNYASGDLLRTFLLPSTPLCLSLDPCERAIFVGHEDGCVRQIDVFDPTAEVNTLYDERTRSTPVQVKVDSWSGGPSNVGQVYCLGLSYDGTTLLSGHDSGKIISWDVGPRRYSTEISDLNAPVTNLVMLSPFPDAVASKTVTVVKPRLGQTPYTWTGQFVTALSPSTFLATVRTTGFPAEILEAAISDFSLTTTSNHAGDEKLRKENQDLWQLVNEQRALQKRTYEKFKEATS